MIIFNNHYIHIYLWRAFIAAQANMTFITSVEEFYTELSNVKEGTQIVNFGATYWAAQGKRSKLRKACY